MNNQVKTSTVFWIMVKRDLVIQLRNWAEFIFRVAMLPFILILTYGYVLPKIGILSEDFPNQMFPGMIGMSLLITGIHGTAVPLSMDFNNSREIEDRLQAPVSIKVTAWSKMVVGIIESWIGALIVSPVSVIFMGSYLNFSMTSVDILQLILILLISSVTSATLGLLVGTIVKPMQIAAMFPGFLMPIIFTGAIFFNWASLSAIPVMKGLVLLNPLVYINEALRSTMIETSDAMPIWLSLGGIVVFTLVMGIVGMKRFKKMAAR
ncbi:MULTISPECIES: ABC transporter permease [Vagococcus]|uniref:Transport permease protein n=1 Tax=Vagococcus fluvialis bH819 TaxID=1255619 RepID=A0A1X6WKI5_9ENTE|nr:MULTISPECIES: ABC transporter permease [Vagococcus]SLM84833.1 ABC transporter, permease protein [Vagococcus fluvialis bH819]HCM89140.1 ABC transporter [Vagococcus sp.]